MSIYRNLLNFAADWRADRAFARTERLIGALPREIQKDIGWPDLAVTRKSTGAGHWAGA